MKRAANRFAHAPIAVPLSKYAIVRETTRVEFMPRVSRSPGVRVRPFTRRCECGFDNRRRPRRNDRFGLDRLAAGVRGLAK